jgi:hypothetical protein
MNHDTQEVNLELASQESRSEYIKPCLELLASWSNTIGISIPIEP